MRSLRVNISTAQGLVVRLEYLRQEGASVKLRLAIGGGIRHSYRDSMSLS